VSARLEMTTPFILRAVKAYPGDESNKQHLDDGKLGHLGHGEARLSGRDLLSGLGLGIHGLGVTRHFYIY